MPLGTEMPAEITRMSGTRALGRDRHVLAGGDARSYSEPLIIVSNLLRWPQPTKAPGLLIGGVETGSKGVETGSK